MINDTKYKVSKNYYNDNNTNKKRIILTDTKRKNVDLYYNTCEFMGSFPHFVIAKDGIIFQFIPTKYEPINFYKNQEFNNKSIIVAFDNMGFLKIRKNIAKNYIGDELSDIDMLFEIEQSWRGYKHWEYYTKDQIKSGALLCNKLCNENNIPKDCYYHNHTIDEGTTDCIISESSILGTEFRSVSPAFDWSLFKDSM